MSFEANIFINKIQRIPTPKIQELLRKQEKEINELSYIDQNVIINFIGKRFSILENIDKSEIIFNRMLFKQLSGKNFFSQEVNKSAEEDLVNMQLMPLIESLQYIEISNVEEVLKRYYRKLPIKIIETLIINLPEKRQVSAIKMCKLELMNSEPNTFNNFMASISKDAQKYVLENFGDKFKQYSTEELSDVSTYLYQDNMSLYIERYQTFLDDGANLFEILMACNEDNFEATINQLKEQLQKLDADTLMKVLCFKTRNSKMLLDLWCGMQDKLREVSIPYFKILVRRLENKERFDAIYQLKDKFSEMDLNEIIELFEYDTDEVKAQVLIEYRDRFSGETSDTLRMFMTESVKNKMLDLYVNKQLKEFEEERANGIDLTAKFKVIVSELKDDKKHKLFDEDYISAIVLGKILIEDRTINDQNESYIELSQKYMRHLFKSLRSDNTADNNVSKGLFYRIMKGKLSFNSVNSLETVKALIYLSRNPQTKDAEEVEKLVSDLSEHQVQSYNIKLYKKICDKMKEICDKTAYENIQKLSYKMFFAFGYDKTLRILESQTSFTTLEYLVNDINLRHIKLNADGTPILNPKLQNFLFGSNKNEANTNINRLLKDEIINFDKYFSSIYNDWDIIYKKLNGNISLSRILELYKDSEIFLKPDEYLLEEPLQEIGTTRPEIVQKAKEWYQIMKERQYSTIPKVKGNVDEYEYEMLDLDNPLALAVGYITRCCFLIDGLSKESLYHSISSKNGRTFIVRKEGELIAQSWVWRNGNVLCFDNVETRGIYNSNKLLETYQKASENLLEISDLSENEIECLKVITFGISESKMSRTKKSFKEGQLPRVLENVGYSDAKYGQDILTERSHGELYYGQVTARYQDPRPLISEYRNIKGLDDKEVARLNKELDGIEYSITGDTRKINARNCRYIAHSKDWYIEITDNGKVKIQILKKDERAIDECKEKVTTIIKEIKDDKMVIPIDFTDAGGEDR